MVEGVVMSSSVVQVSIEWYWFSVSRYCMTAGYTEGCCLIQHGVGQTDWPEAEYTKY